ncbi:MAG: ATP-binding cassette domain-containing protein [Nitrospinae bacterium]|nr:ATP-binding cassette domain-containing protein [Nitrospinota bacterium]
MIRVSDLSKQYGALKAIDQVNFHVEKGEIVGFLGPNGAGKSTTMKILTCFTQPTSGSVNIAGFDAFNDSIEVRKRIGYLPENTPLYEEMTPRSLLRFIAGLKGVPTKEQNKKVEEVISLFGIAKFSGKLIKYISKGQKQRVGIAQAMIGEPEILILDEPTVGLDPKQIHEIRDIIKNMQGKRTVILSTHILPEVSMTCQRILIINKGKIVTEESTVNLMSRFHSHNIFEIEIDGDEKKVQSVLRDVKNILRIDVKEKSNDQRNIYEIETEKNIDNRREISHAVVHNGLGLLSFKTVSRSLEDIFLELVTDEKEAEVKDE